MRKKVDPLCAMKIFLKTKLSSVVYKNIITLNIKINVAEKPKLQKCIPLKETTLLNL